MESFVIIAKIPVFDLSVLTRERAAGPNKKLLSRRKYPPFCLRVSISVSQFLSYHPAVVFRSFTGVSHPVPADMIQPDFSPFLHILNKNKTQICFMIRTIKGTQTAKSLLSF